MTSAKAGCWHPQPQGTLPRVCHPSGFLIAAGRGGSGVLIRGRVLAVARFHAGCDRNPGARFLRPCAAAGETPAAAPPARCQLPAVSCQLSATSAAAEHRSELRERPAADHASAAQRPGHDAQRAGLRVWKRKGPGARTRTRQWGRSGGRVQGRESVCVRLCTWAGEWGVHRWTRAGPVLSRDPGAGVGPPGGRAAPFMRGRIAARTARV